MPAKWDSRFEHKKKSGTWIYVPTAEYRDLGKEIKLAIEKKWNSPSYYFHLKAGGHIAALRAHDGNTYFSHLDIANFFGSVSKSRVTRHLKNLFSYKIARDYAEYSTVRSPNSGGLSIPFGFVQSSIVASLCLYKSALGRAIANCAKNPNLAVSVYVDDIIVSSKNKQLLDLATTEIQSSAERSLFKLNKAKESISSPQITAFNIELTANELSLSQKRLREFSEVLKNGPDDQVRKGILGYVHSVNADQAAQLVSLAAPES